MTVHYERLSHLDASFLALESRSTHMHVGAVVVFDVGSLGKADGGIDMAAIRRHVAAKLHLIPRYRQRLAWVPLERHPVWVDDEYFNLDYHVRHTSLPRPGSEDQLKQLAGMLMSQGLDREKPLWELYVVEGIEGNRFAIVSKIHHAMIDGIAGVDLMAVLLGLGATDEIDGPPLWEPRPVPNGTELFVRETTRRLTSLVSSIGNVGTLRGEFDGIADDAMRRLRAVGASLSSGWLVPTGKTPINGAVGPNRRFEWLDLELTDVKRVKDCVGGSVNDVILATVAGGVRSFLIEERGLSSDELEELDYRVMAPVSVRASDQRGTMGNHVAMWLVTLPVGVADPVRQLRIIREQTRRLKNDAHALGAATIVQVSAGAPSTLVSLGARLAANVRPFNATVTNVPGPQFPLYLLGAKVEATYPLVPLWESHGVGIALFSYAGRVHWGFNGDYDLLGDLDRFAAVMGGAFAALSKAADEAPDEPADEPGAPPEDGPRKRPPLGTP